MNDQDRRHLQHEALVGPMTLLGFQLNGVVEVLPLHYAIFKGIWAGLMAAILVIPMVLVALRSCNEPNQLHQMA